MRPQEEACGPWTEAEDRESPGVSTVAFSRTLGSQLRLHLQTLALHNYSSRVLRYASDSALGLAR